MFYLNTVKLTNFRCYSSKSIELSPHINIIFGDNAAGKTTILEAISYNSLCKSFKNANDIDLIKHNNAHFSVFSHCYDNNNDSFIEINYSQNGKKVSKNGKKYTKLSEYIGFIQSISFEPNDLEVIKGAPTERRRLLNTYISQYDSEYIVKLSNYNKILKLRNDYLKKQEELDDVYLNVLSESLSKEGKYIISQRENFIKCVNEYANEAAMAISSGFESLEIKYTPSVLVSDYENKQISTMKKDKIVKSTTIGPHKDDFIVLINEEDVSLYGSQGQIRTAMIAIKLGIAKYLEKYNNKQIILLDDVFSELDIHRQEQLLKLLSDDKQILITTTDINDISKEIIKKSNIIKIVKGE